MILNAQRKPFLSKLYVFPIFDCDHCQIDWKYNKNVNYTKINKYAVTIISFSFSLSKNERLFKKN